jgi:hypothetical protein
MGKDAFTTMSHTLYSDLQRHAPDRAVDWRAERACRVVEDDVRPRIPQDDAETLALVGYLRARKKCRTEGDRTLLRRDWPALHAAWELAEGDALLRWEVEARLLARQTDEEIAARCGLDPHTVRSFEAIFFCVRDRLHASDWVTFQAVRGGPWNSFAGDQPGTLWRAVAYSGGPLLLDLVIAVTTGRPLPDSIRASFASFSGNAAHEEARLRLRCKLTLALMTARSPAEVKAVVEAREQLRRLDGEARTGDVDSTLLAMEAFLKGLAGTGRARPGNGKGPAASARPAAGARTSRQRRTRSSKV